MKRLIIVLLLLLIIEYYSYTAFKMGTGRLSPGPQLLLSLLYGILILGELLSFYFLFQLGSSAVSSGWTSYLVTIAFSIILGKLLLTVIMLLGDLGLVIHKGLLFIDSLHHSSPLSSTRPVVSRSAFIARLALVAGGILTAGMIYGISNRYDYKVHRRRLKFKNLPNAFKGLRIVQLSDIHSGSLGDREAVLRGIEMVNRENPDIILFTGDLVNNRADEVSPWTTVFSQLKAPMGVYAVLGNHDYGDYVHWPSPEAKQQNLTRLKATEAHMGWKMLNNEHVILQKENEQIALIGVENWGAKGHFSQYGNLDQAMKGLEKQPIPFKLLMSHDPSHWDAQVRREYPDIDLTLSGHTHGMQFGIEIPGIKWSPVQYMYKEWAGLYKNKTQYLYVNRGFGFIGYQGRLGILPEITVLELS